MMQMKFLTRNAGLHTLLLFICQFLQFINSQSKDFRFSDKTDRLALLSFKNYITHDPENILASWNHTTHLCEWSGISCSHRHQRVTSLELPDMGMVGLITPQITNLTFLRVFRLSNNSFHGKIHKEINRLFHLHHLDLSLNLIDGEIPETLTQCSALRSLSLENNMLTGKIPAKLGSLSRLESLSLSNNNLEGNIPPSLGNLSSLFELTLSQNKLQGSIPPSLGNLSSLLYLFLDQNNLQGSIPQGLCSLQNLKWLVLAYDRLEGSFPSCLGNLICLEQLEISFNQFHGGIPPTMFDNQTQLQLVAVSNNQLDGYVSFSIFANHSQLFWIDLSNNTELVVDTEYPSWSPSFQLYSLALSNCNVNMRSNGKIPTFLSTQFFLHYIDLSSNGLMGNIPSSLFQNQSRIFLHVNLRNNSLEDSLPHVFSGNASGTQILDISNNRIRGILPTNINMHFPELFFLNMSSNELHGSVSFSFSSMLEILDLSNNDFMGGITNQMLANATALHHLDLSKNRFVGNMLPSYCNMPNLEVLYLGGNRFTGTIASSLYNISRLKVLDIGGNFLSGTIPSWFPTISNLTAMIFKENQLNGNIPNQICEMKNLRIIDISQNQLPGRMPSCFTNITSLKKRTPSEIPSVLQFTFLSAKSFVDFTTKGHSYSYQGIVLSLMTGIDISGNKLSGNIPSDLGDLKELRALNLSNNRLIGPIPESFQKLEQLESLDLSFNQLNGSIPPTLCLLDSLASFNVSYNNFSGKTPDYKGHCTTFSAESYAGNPGLCGEPLERNCSNPATKVEENGEESGGIDIVLYACFVFAYILGFWSVIILLYFKMSWRLKYFEAVDGCINYFVVYILVFISNRCMPRH